MREIQQVVEKSHYRRVAVLPFTPYPGLPNSGEEAADLFSEDLSNLGFTLVDRMDVSRMLSEQKFSMSGAVKAEEAAHLGKLLGVQAIVVGTVGEASLHQVRHPAVYANVVDTKIDKKGEIHERPHQELVRPAESSDVAIYSVTVRMIDVETGALLWVDSGSDKQEDETIQNVASDVVNEIVKNLGKKIYRKGL